MAAYNKFNSFVQQLSKKALALDGSPPPDTLKIMLTDISPTSSQTFAAHIFEIAAGNGYLASGSPLSNVTGTFAVGTETLAADQTVFAASGGSIAQFRYVVLYDFSATSSPLIAWWDYGAEVNVTTGNTFTVQYNGVATGGTIYTLS